MNDLQNNRLIFFFLAVALITASLFFLDIFIGPKYGGDIEWYIAAAQGRWNELIQPYSARFLHPFIVGFISSQSPLDVYRVFLIIATVSLFFFFVCNIAILKNIIKKPLFLFPIFFLPFFYDTLRYIFHPDAFYIFLTALFFLSLFYQKDALSLLFLFFLFLTRESAIILAVVFGIVSWFRNKKLLVFGIVFIMLISIFTTNLIASVGRSNIHGMNNSAYIFLKFGYNFLANIFGAKLWVNTYHTCEPVFKVSLPSLTFLGNIREAGFCGFDLSLPINTFTALLTVFGIAPFVFFYTFCKKTKHLLEKIPFWVLVAAVFGFIQYLIGISAGTSVSRIVGYGWPAFLLVTPLLLGKFFEVDKKFIIKLSLVHLLVAWLPFIVQKIGGSGIGFLSITLFLILLIYFYAFRLLKKQKKINAGFLFQ